MTHDSVSTGVSDERLAEIVRQVGTTDMDLIAGREIHAMATELLSRRSASNAAGGGVKALQWIKSNAAQRWTAQYPFGQFEIIRILYEREDGRQFSWLRGICSEYFVTLEEAQTACQADFNARVLSALEPIQAGGDDPVAWMAFNKDGACELFLDETNALAWADDGGHTVALLAAHGKRPFVTITPHMLNAGTDQITSPTMDTDDKKDLAVKVFRAMIAARTSTALQGYEPVAQMVREIEVLLGNCHVVEDIDIAAQHEAAMVLVRKLATHPATPVSAEVTVTDAQIEALYYAIDQHLKGFIAASHVRAPITNRLRSVMRAALHPKGSEPLSKEG